MLEKFDPSRISNHEELDKARSEHQDLIYKKLKYKSQIEDAKKQAAAGFREQLTVINEELATEIAIVDSILDRKKFIS